MSLKKYSNNILLRFIKLILIFVSITEKKNTHWWKWRKYVLFGTDVYFTEYILAVEIDEKGHTDRNLIFEEKWQEALKKNLVVDLLELIRVKKAMMQTMKLVEYKHLSVNLKTDN